MNKSTSFLSFSFTCLKFKHSLCFVIINLLITKISYFIILQNSAAVNLAILLRPYLKDFNLGKHRIAAKC